MYGEQTVGAQGERGGLPASLVSAIGLQPRRIEVLTDRIDADERARHLLAILTLAQDISAEYRYFWRVQPNDLAEEGMAAAAFLALPEPDYLTLKEQLIEAMA